jgi:C1A family cysteine protease
MSDENFSGYDILKHGETDNERLDMTSLSFSAASSAPGEVHEEVDPTEFLKVENQGSLPSCVGHAVTTAAECAAGLASGRWSDVPQLSRKFAWQNGQQKWMGRIDARQGCTIAHGVQAAISDGVCPESSAPYGTSGSSLTGSAYTAATQYRLQNQVEISSADDARRFLEAGFGAIVCGVIWTKRMGQCSGRLSERDVREDGSRGGHAICLVGFNRTGQFLLANSWGSGWGDDGIARVDPDAVDYLCGRPYTVMRGVTDLTGFDRTRPFTSWGM